MSLAGGGKQETETASVSDRYPPAAVARDGAHVIDQVALKEEVGNDE
jgi:hypothetical protein